VPSTVVQTPKTAPPQIVITTTMVMPQPQTGGGQSGGN
jgi:hypothetical protein